jgi:hypothetical protein
VDRTGTRTKNGFHYQKSEAVVNRHDNGNAREHVNCSKTSVCFDKQRKASLHSAPTAGPLATLR